MLYEVITDTLKDGRILILLCISASHSQHIFSRFFRNNIKRIIMGYDTDECGATINNSYNFV